MATEIGSIGEDYPIKFRRGTTFGPVAATMESSPGVPANLTGCVIEACIRHAVTDAEILANFVVSVPSPLTGQYSFSIPAVDTADVPAGKHVWDMRMTDAGGIVRPLYYGVVTVQDAVTRT